MLSWQRFPRHVGPEISHKTVLLLVQDPPLSTCFGPSTLSGRPRRLWHDESSNGASEVSASIVVMPHQAVKGFPWPRPSWSDAIGVRSQWGHRSATCHLGRPLPLPRGR